MTDTRQRAIEDVARVLEHPAKTIKRRMRYPNDYPQTSYMVNQRERVLILEAENAELKAKLEGK